MWFTPSAYYRVVYPISVLPGCHRPPSRTTRVSSAPIPYYLASIQQSDPSGPIQQSDPSGPIQQAVSSGPIQQAVSSGPIGILPVPSAFRQCGVIGIPSVRCHRPSAHSVSSALTFYTFDQPPALSPSQIVITAPLSSQPLCAVGAIGCHRLAFCPRAHNGP